MSPPRRIRSGKPLMPIYEFECPTCAHRFERLQRLADADPTECPECHGSGVRRRLTAPAFRLSGSGWYETDFKKDGDAKRNLVSKDEAPKAPASDAAKPAAADSKSDATAKPAAPKPAASSSD
jgi:putative FmdB family regulatory protein